MAKRIVTRIGNVFCVEIDGKYKCYFQYIANDLEQLNSSVIRVFRKHYSMDYNPVIDEIITDEIAFYAHVILRSGIADKVWYKVGTSKELGLEGLDKVLFGTTFDLDDDGCGGLIEVNPLENWTIWYVNKPRIKIGILPKKYYDIIECKSSVMQYPSIIDRIKFGYVIGNDIAYNILKRKPWDDVDSYVKVVDGDVVRYSHFLGQTPMREMVVSRFGIVRLSREHPESQGETLRRAQFWETNWNFFNFIEPAEFDDLWQRE